MTAQKTTSIDDLLQILLETFKERDWFKFHSPKNIAMNLGVETGELMEYFRWLKDEDSQNLKGDALQGVKEEIADCFNMLVYLSYLLDIDPIKASIEKINIIKKRYPVDQCFGKCDKYTKYQHNTIDAK